MGDAILEYMGMAASEGDHHLLAYPRSLLRKSAVWIAASMLGFTSAMLFSLDELFAGDGKISAFVFILIGSGILACCISFMIAANALKQSLNVKHKANRWFFAAGKAAALIITNILIVFYSTMIGWTLLSHYQIG
jgi:hypothetical protein